MPPEDTNYFIRAQRGTSHFTIHGVIVTADELDRIDLTPEQATGVNPHLFIRLLETVRAERARVRQMTEDVYLTPGNTRPPLPPLHPLQEIVDSYAYTESAAKEIEVKKPKLKKIAKEEEEELYKKARALRSVEDTYTSKWNAKQPRLDSRVREYLYMRRNQKVISIEEVAGSEFPIAIENLSTNHIRELQEIGVKGLKDWHINKEGYNCFCQTCYRLIPLGTAFILGRILYCAEHVPTAIVCYFCGKLSSEYAETKTFDGKTINVCASCKTSRSSCRNCREPILPKYLEFRQCARCLARPERSGPYRPFSMNLKWVSEVKGLIMQSKRMFSSEIEAFGDKPDVITVLSKTLPNETGISSDSSIAGGYSFELQTPRLGGKTGEEFLFRVGASLKEVRAQVNLTCGMHIHLDGAGLLQLDRRAYPLELVQLWKAYMVFEDVILSLIPYRRRSNHFCRPMNGSFSLAELDEIRTLTDAEKLWYKQDTFRDIHEAKRHHHHSSRYFGINLHPLLSQGHLEVRFHSGTTAVKKILHWANLHALILDAAVLQRFTHAVLQDAMASSLQERTEMLFSIIDLSDKGRQYFLERQQKFNNKLNDE